MSYLLFIKSIISFGGKKKKDDALRMYECIYQNIKKQKYYITQKHV